MSLGTFRLVSGRAMNVFRILIPCALQPNEENDDGVVNWHSGGGCWSLARGPDNDSHMTHRMGASASTNFPASGGDPVQAARLSSSGNTDQFGIVVRYVILAIPRSNFS